LLAEPDEAPALLSQWEKYSWPGLNSDEAGLMTLEDGLPLWLIYATFPDHVRATCLHWISLMAAGMEEMLDPEYSASVTWHDDIRLLTNVQAYNEYCYSVAGTVGGLGTELVIAHYDISERVAERMLEGSMACGRALQKTNIIKDFAEDAQRGVCYLPDEWLRQIGYTPLTLAGAPVEWSDLVLGDVLIELRDATEYVRSIPVDAKGYRIAALVCLLPAYQTMTSAAQRRAQLFTKEHQIKISRETMAHCLADAVALAPDNDAIAEHCQRLAKAISTEFQSMAV
jgi:farnesyl-diphosphate farnesyltransferase